jgi:hypothetical protein
LSGNRVDGPRSPASGTTITNRRTEAAARDAQAHRLQHHDAGRLHLMTGAVMLGDGAPIFEGGSAVSLRPIDSRTWDDSNNVLLRYHVRRN